MNEFTNALFMNVCGYSRSDLCIFNPIKLNINILKNLSSQVLLYASSRKYLTDSMKNCRWRRGRVLPLTSDSPFLSAVVLLLLLRRYYRPLPLPSPLPSLHCSSPPYHSRSLLCQWHDSLWRWHEGKGGDPLYKEIVSSPFNHLFPLDDLFLPLQWQRDKIF